MHKGVWSMPEGSGEGSVLNAEAKGLLPASGKGQASLQQKMSRARAFRRVKQLLVEQHILVDEAIDLITAFQMEADELTEAGVSYEMVRALERHLHSGVPENFSNSP